MSTFREKYLKYKMKYIQLKNQLGGLCKCDNKAESIAECNICSQRVTSNSVASSSATASMGNAQSSSSVPRNAGDINVTVVSMSGKNASFPISRDARISDLKQLIQTENEFDHPEIYRQKLVYRPGPHGMEPLADRLTLFDCGIGRIPGDEIVVDLIYEEGDLRTFYLAVINRIKGLIRNNSGKELVDLLSQYTGDLSLGAPYDTFTTNPADVILLANALMGNTTVRHLNISFNRVGDVGVREIAKMLTVNTTLTSIDLRSMEIGDMGAEALADAFKVNNTLTRIDLRSNNIGDVGAHHIADMMRDNTAIRYIYLDQNLFRAEGIAELEAAKALRPRDHFIITPSRR